MPKMSFEVRFHGPELRGVDVPVEVRRARGRSDPGRGGPPIRVLSSGSVSVEPGRYVVATRLPAGVELTSIVQVKDADLSVVLEPDEEDRSPSETQEAVRYLSRRPFSFEALAFDSGVRAPRLRLLAGNVLAGKLDDRRECLRRDPRSGGAARWQVDNPRGEPLVMQIRAEGKPPLNACVPAAPDQPANLVLAGDDAGGFELHLASTAADLLLGYTARGAWSSAELTVEAGALSAKTLLFQKERDPIAACVGAYALLRLGKLELLHDWTDNLHRWFSWLPDGAAIRAEHLCRLGRHDEARSALLDLPGRGLPIFRDGLSYAVTLLRRYGRAQPELAAHLDTLEPFLLFSDSSRSITTYPGASPAHPERTRATTPPDEGEAAW